jgi:hypothetical protein
MVDHRKPKLTLVSGPSIPERIKSLELVTDSLEEKVDAIDKVVRRHERLTWIALGVVLTVKFLAAAGVLK